MVKRHIISDYSDCDGDGKFWLNIKTGFIYYWDDLPAEVREALREAGRGPKLQWGQHFKSYHPSYREIMRWMIEGALGAVILFGLLWVALAVLT